MAEFPRAIRDQLATLAEQSYQGSVDAVLKAARAEVETELARRLSRKTSSQDRHDKKIAVDVDHMSRTYRLGDHDVTALRDISLRVFEGEIVAIMGPSGSGKSTLLNLIGGLESPDKGAVSVFNKQISQLNDGELSHYRNTTVGFVFQFFYLQPYLSVRENVEIPLLFTSKNGAARRHAAEEAIESVQLSDRLTHLPSQLSGGQMQRTAIARALIAQPRLILADEPTGNLDRATGHDILQLLTQINRERGTTMIIVTHDAEVAARADRIILLRDGEVVHD